MSAASKVAFAALIREVKTRIDSSNDKIGKLVLEFRPEGDLVAELDKLHRPVTEVYVVVMEKPE